MLKIAEVQFHPWDKAYDFYVGDHSIKIGDNVLVKTELGSEIGKVVSIKEDAEDKYELIATDEREDENSAAPLKDIVAEKLETKRKLRTIICLATAEDLKKVAEHEEQKLEIIAYCENVIKRMNLPMKLVDADISFDGGRITFAFISEGRVDFRDLVKDVARHFQRSIRMQQVGVRDEAKTIGDFGHCGRELCCRKFLVNLGGVNAELAANQQIAHRGSGRLSGACGRLMCCLRYENDQYIELVKNLPPLGSEINTPQGKGKVINWHTLNQTVDVKMADGNILAVDVSKS